MCGIMIIERSRLMDPAPIARQNLLSVDALSNHPLKITFVSSIYFCSFAALAVSSCSSLIDFFEWL